MERVSRLLVDAGRHVREQHRLVSALLPSRATWITGQYAHNHGVIDNQERNGGGYEALRDPDRVLPAWLDAAGYDTALVGKWLHDYRTLRAGARLGPLLGADLADDGQLLRLRDHRLARRQASLRRRRLRLPHRRAHPRVRAALHPRPRRRPAIRSSSTSPTPPRTGGAAATTPPAGAARTASRSSSRPRRRSRRRATPAPSPTGALPMPPSFNERDMSDKPGAVRGRQRLDRGRSGRAHRALPLRARQPARRRPGGRRRSTPRSTTPGSADRTYVIFTSDNGYMHGEHRISAEKVQPYEEALRVPLVIRGPAIPAGRARSPIRSPTSTSRRRSSTSPRCAGAAGARPPDRRPLARPVHLRPRRPRPRDPDRVQAAAARAARRAPSSPRRGSGCAPAATSTSSTTGPRSPSLEQGFGLPIGAGARHRRRALRPRARPARAAEPPRRPRLRASRARRSPRRSPSCAAARARTARSTSSRRRRACAGRRAARAQAPRARRPIKGLMFDIDAALR